MHHSWPIHRLNSTLAKHLQLGCGVQYIIAGWHCMLLSICSVQKVPGFGMMKKRLNFLSKCSLDLVGLGMIIWIPLLAWLCTL
mmetsp:Transcript_105200/g.302531  ORF Transcript_105200/g.302531 Transcript_105200/m.302531 type:complete len:83 (-) Transcript_105200:1265-1513(-)